ncbi:MAG: polyphosphate kinase 1 [Tannerellaceae bacterium]|jgi:polyphosphate kinase|nr:polyphosphate kinase 1 [Tannerellaceae bacterium]
MPGASYTYFKRDISWLSFNARVLMEASDKSLPLFERIRFLSIYSSNLEEFYEIRVADHRAVIMKKKLAEETSEDAEQTLSEINTEVNRQQREYYRIFSDLILPTLRREGIFLYQDSSPKEFHKDFVRDFFGYEVFPFLSPVMLQTGEILTFIRDRRLYLIVRLIRKDSKRGEDADFHYALIKIPFAKVPRFIELPRHEGVCYIMFIDDIIRANLSTVFPGYIVESCHSIKISRDADIYLENEKAGNLIEAIRSKVKKRTTGDLSRFMYDGGMPSDFLGFVCRAFGIKSEDLVVGGRYLNLQDLNKLPNPTGKSLEHKPFLPMRIAALDKRSSMFEAIEEKDILLHFPYQSFDYVVRLLMEAAFDDSVDEIKITQYRVAENSAVINTLISAARNGKKVTVFVELKARFDEENNMSTAEMMKLSGIRIIYSIPGLKVHSKVAVILRKRGEGEAAQSGFACLSTGNFNEKTARVYSDMALLTARPQLIEDINRLFAVLEGKLQSPVFRLIQVAPFNMAGELKRMISLETGHALTGRKARIILKMNGLHERNMIDELYRASESGVETDLIIRGICCLVPNKPYSRNTRVTRIVDMFLEHARIWYFFNDGEENLYLSSADWMRRNLTRRIETAFPILDPSLKSEIIEILNIQLRDNTKACLIDEHLVNRFKHNDNPVKTRSQTAIHDFLKEKEERSGESL